MEGQRAAEWLTGIRYKWLPKHKARGKEQSFEDREARESGPTKLRGLKRKKMSREPI